MQNLLRKEEEEDGEEDEDEDEDAEARRGKKRGCWSFLFILSLKNWKN